jgi:hypothetical protein
MNSALDQLRVLVPGGMLGSGFPPETITHGINRGADAIVIDGGSTDSGPYYLGTGTAKTSEAAVRHDLHILLTSARAADIPLIVTSCGTSGTDSGVDWAADIVTSIAQQEHLTFRLATIYSEQNVEILLSALNAGRIAPLAPLGPLQAVTLRSCTHISVSWAVSRSPTPCARAHRSSSPGARPTLPRLLPSR